MPTSRTFNGSVVIDGDDGTHVLFVHLIANPGTSPKWVLTDCVRRTPEELAASPEKPWKSLDKVELAMRPESVKKVTDWLAKRDLSSFTDALRREMSRLKAQAEDQA